MKAIEVFSSIAFFILAVPLVGDVPLYSIQYLVSNIQELQMSRILQELFADAQLVIGVGEFIPSFMERDKDQ